MKYVRECPNCGLRIAVGDDEGVKNFCSTCGASLWNKKVESEIHTEQYNLITAYKSMWKKYAQFKGRSGRREYWYAMLGNWIVTMAIYLFMIPGIIEIARNQAPTTVPALMMATGFLVMTGYIMAAFIPSLAINVRRLHDTGRSGWFMFLILIPYVGSIILLIFTVSDSQNGANQYGANPKELL